MRKLAAEYLPSPILQREKQGFMLPVAYWFRTDLFPVVSQTLKNSHFVKEGWFKREYIQQLLDEHHTNRYDHHVRLWMLLNLEVWHQLYIENTEPAVLAERLHDLCLPQ
jgi:asparagine synthase (glutamine-hydrolysing)